MENSDNGQRPQSKTDSLPPLTAPNNDNKLPDINMQSSMSIQQLNSEGPQTQRRLLESKRKLTKMDSDWKLLANRIALLKQEEMRTWKKIDETKTKTKDIMDLKLQNYQKVAKTESKSTKKMGNLEQIQKQNFELSQKRVQDKRKLEMEIKEQKEDLANKLKKQTKRNEKKKKKILTRIRSENQLKSQIVKQQEQYALLYKEAFERKKRQQIAENYLARVKSHDRLIGKKEKELMQMEMLEMDLIKNLQNTQNFQRQAYQDLERALMTQNKEQIEEKIKQFQDENTQMSRTIGSYKKKQWKRNASVGLGATGF